MRDQFETQLQELLEQILVMGGTTEAMIELAVRSLLERNATLAAEIFEKERQVNALEMDVDDRVVGLIVHYQPVARDARFATTALRVATDLERIGDQAVNVLKNTQYVLQQPPCDPPEQLRTMAELARRMVADGLTALTTRDCDLAEQVLEVEKQVDFLKDETFRTLLSAMITDPLMAQRSLSMVLISRNLERIADHATNMAEEVIYLVRGHDVRHQFDRAARPG